ncbi:amino acid ABC transporter permease [Methylocapsa aurea]|uniref:amino acid ABC transporter permease n=1 Tax=Methylocapsa aurea TaxID=663610 RepID=UPI000691D56B|nr:ABC transporter permease subunit [Methylocapsa aurea]
MAPRSENGPLAFWYDPAIRGRIYQTLFVLALGIVLFEAIVDVRANMQARGIPTDFDFLDDVAGFDINLTLIPYSATSTYGRAFFVGLLNTGLAAALGLILATVVGFAIGIARLSKNWIVAKFAMVYVEALRNVPLLLQLLFWYNAVLKPLPAPRQSYVLPFGMYLNNRGLFAPELVFGPGAQWIGAAVIVAALVAVLARLTGIGARLGRFWPTLLIGLPVAAYFLAGQPVSFIVPELKGFNFSGGVRLLPEFVALVLGLGLYTAAFIAEIVRAGVEAVPRGQSEAAAALGLSRRQTNRFVVVPQAMRIITPLLTSQYLNLIKNSSLAVFIGYPDLVQVFAGTVLNQTGAAVQVIFITMAVYLAISLFASLAMNLYNRRFALVER